MEAGRDGGRQGGMEAGRDGGRQGGMEGGREGWRQGGVEAGRDGGRQGGMEGGREGWRQGGMEAGRDRRREGWREAGRNRGREGWMDTGRDGGREVGGGCNFMLPKVNHMYYGCYAGENTPPYYYGTHYSSAMIVASYLIRMEPFSQYFLKLQVCDVLYMFRKCSISQI